MVNTTNHKGEQIRVILLANQPRMLREMLHRALEKLPGVRLILETDAPRQIPSILDRVAPDWLITTLTPEAQLPEAVAEAIEHNPSVSVLGLSADGSKVEIRGAERSDDGRKAQRDIIVVGQCFLVRVAEYLGRDV